MRVFYDATARSGLPTDEYLKDREIGKNFKGKLEGEVVHLVHRLLNLEVPSFQVGTRGKIEVIAQVSDTGMVMFFVRSHTGRFFYNGVYVVHHKDEHSLLKEARRAILRAARDAEDTYTAAATAYRAARTWRAQIRNLEKMVAA